MSRTKSKHETFDHLTFRGTKIESPVPKNPGITFLWYWNEEKGKYDVPPIGIKRYRAVRRKILGGRVFREQKCLDRLEDCREWRSFKEPIEMGSVSESTTILPQTLGGPKFEEVVQMWKDARWKVFAISTRGLYEKLLKYLEFFHGMDVRSITPSVVDEWLRHMTSDKVVKKQHSTRENYRHELELLSGILRYYSEYHDDPIFMFPLKRRHSEAGIVKKVRSKNKDPMTPKHFEEWVSHLRTQENGLMKEALACTQRSAALRISEAAALHWEDINWDKRFVTVRRSVIWGRKKGTRPIIQNGFKNGDKKEVPLTPDAYHLLKRLDLQKKCELVFHVEGKPLEFRMIQYAYNAAFKAAGLSFRGTHVMRRTGTSWVLDISGGDVGLAKQILGNSDWATVSLYAKRQSNALKEFNDKLWREHEMST